MDDTYHVVNGLGSTKHMDQKHINLEEIIFSPRLMKKIDKNVVSDLLKENTNLESLLM